MIVANSIDHTYALWIEMNHYDVIYFHAVTDVALCHHCFNNNVLMLSLLIEVYIIKTI